MNCSAILRQELIRRAEAWQAAPYFGGHVYRSKGNPPTVLFERYSLDGVERHGNFLQESFAAILGNREWCSRLEKPHSQARSLPEEKRSSAKELDSCNSSDALAMNIFCHPATIRLIPALFGWTSPPMVRFGVQVDLARTSITSGSSGRATEVDLEFVFPAAKPDICEAKLTEKDFTQKDADTVESYRDLDLVFDRAALPRSSNGDYESYQLIRNVLAAHHLGGRFFLICDWRRPDLLRFWWEIHAAIKEPAMRQRCGFVTWQELASLVSPDLKSFLREKYGILA